MDVREGIARRIENKRKEVADLELKIREQLAYIRALEDTLRLMSGEDAEETNKSARVDSDVGKSQRALKTAGQPMYISELLKAIGKPDDKRSRISLAGTLAGYARRNHIFTRTGPNTFGLTEFGQGAKDQDTSPHTSVPNEPPDDFGMISAEPLIEDVPF